MTHTKITMLALSLSALTACGVEPDLTSYDPPASKLIYDHTDVVKGAVQQDGVELRFRFEHTANDATHLILESGDGFVLVDSVVGKGSEATSILGTYHIDGASSAVRIPSNALSDLEAMPEMQLVPALQRKLLAEGIDIAQLVPVESSLGPILCPTAEPPADFTEKSTGRATRN